jgi:class 3 adenylate cyclase
MSLESIVKLCRAARQEGLADAFLPEYLDAVATIQDGRIQQRLLAELIREYVLLEKKVDGLLKNTLPGTVAEEIKQGGKFLPRPFDCTILFSDIVGFTQLAERIPGERLIELLDRLFRGMDDCVVGFGGTKIKTIGDAYMAVFGAPTACDDHAVMALRTGMGFLELVAAVGREMALDLQIRVGVHTGRVMAGVVGRERMQFDVFGDHVNIASRFESAGEMGRVNVSPATYVRTREFFEFEERGEIALKNRGQMRAYFVVRERDGVAG